MACISTAGTVNTSEKNYTADFAVKITYLLISP